MQLTYEEFESDKITPILKIMKIPSSPQMHRWTLTKKLNYLTERKEILYGIWSLEPGGNIFSKNFYRAFANEARLLLSTNHNHMDKLKSFQEEIFKEVCAIFDDPTILNDYYKKHEQEITLIKYHKDEYIKSRVVDYQNLYADESVSANKFMGLSASFQSEIWLLYQRAVVENWKVYMQYFDVTIRQSEINIEKMQNYQKTYKKAFGEKTPPLTMEDTLPQRDKRKEIKESIFPINPQALNKKSEKKFNRLAHKNRTDYKSFYDEYQTLEHKVDYWIDLYKYPWIKYRTHYQSFREAIGTEIMLHERSQLMPQELYDLVKDLVDFKFEKVEFIKNFLDTKENPEIVVARSEPYEALRIWNNEIAKLMKGKEFTKDELKDIKNMCYLRASCLTHQDTEAHVNSDKRNEKITKIKE